MDERPPKVEDAPGLTWRIRGGLWEARWRARADLVQRGYPHKNARLWAGEAPSDIEAAWISDRCKSLQAEMLAWGHGAQKTKIAAFDGTIRSLIACYKTDKDSVYAGRRFKTRQNYDYQMGRIERDTWVHEGAVRVIGDEELEDISARTLKRWHEVWGGGGKVAMGHAMIGMLRGLFTFGATILENKECQRLKGLMHDMRFAMPVGRTEHISADQVIAVRAAAHDHAMPSIALAQAFQFELMLRQKDVIGEWVPQTEPGMSDVFDGNDKWLWGIRWSEVDANMILRHTTSKRKKDIEVNLMLAPMVLEELLIEYPDMMGPTGVRRDALPLSGPIILDEATGVPHVAHNFRRLWRICAKAAKVPDHIRNMDSRAGAISEATDAGAELEHVRHAATHGDIAMTQRYSRGSIDKVAGVMTKRTEFRNKK